MLVATAAIFSVFDMIFPLIEVSHGSREKSSNALNCSL